MALIVLALLLTAVKTANEHLNCERLSLVQLESKDNGHSRFIMEVADQDPPEKLEFNYIAYFLKQDASQSKISSDSNEIYTDIYDGFFCQLNKKVEEPGKYTDDKMERCNNYLRSIPLSKTFNEDTDTVANQKQNESNAKSKQASNVEYGTRCFFFKDPAANPDYIIVLKIQRKFTSTCGNWG